MQQTYVLYSSENAMKTGLLYGQTFWKINVGDCVQREVDKTSLYENTLSGQALTTKG